MLVFSAAAVAVALRSPFGIDYDNDAQPAIDALRAGDFGDVFTKQPLMGSFSVLLRAPFAELAGLFEPSLLLEYRLGAIPCLLAAAGLAWWIWDRMSAVERPLPARLAMAALIVINPMVFFALEAGHPEEVLGGALCVGAVLSASRNRPVLAGVLLGLGIATKHWAVLAVIPTFLALPREQRGNAILVGGALGIALMAPFVIGAPDRFFELTESVTVVDAPAFSFSVWWPLADRSEGPAYVPDLVGAISHPIIVLVGIPLGFLYARRPDRPGDEALLLLALVFLLRCVLDPVDNGYYHVPFLFALVAYEAFSVRGLPKLSIVSSGVLWLDVHVWSDGYPDLANAIYLAWAIPTIAYIAVLLWAERPPNRMKTIQPIGP